MNAIIEIYCKIDHILDEEEEEFKTRGTSKETAETCVKKIDLT